MPDEFRTIGDVRILEFRGRITRGAGDREMRERFCAAQAGGGVKFVFDLREVSFVDSAGIGEMVACLKRARDKDGILKLILVRGGRPDQLLKLAALDRVFEIHSDEHRAVESFSG
jgi:anti-anti-sigma factor